MSSTNTPPPMIVLREQDLFKALENNFQSSYDVLKELKKQKRLADFRIHLRLGADNPQPGPQPVVIEAEDNQGNLYTAGVYYNAETDEVRPLNPYRHSQYYEYLRRAIENDTLYEYRMRPDIFQNSKGEVAIEFVTAIGRYLDIVLQDESGDIHPIKVEKIRYFVKF